MTAYPELVNCRLALNSDGIPEALTVPSTISTLLGRAQQAIDGKRRRSSFSLESQIENEISTRQRMMISQKFGEQESKNGSNLSSGLGNTSGGTVQNIVNDFSNMKVNNEKNINTSSSLQNTNTTEKSPLSNYNEEQKFKLEQLKECTNLDIENCIALIIANNWNLEEALNRHFSKL